MRYAQTRHSFSCREKFDISRLRRSLGVLGGMLLMLLKAGGCASGWFGAMQIYSMLCRTIHTMPFPFRKVRGC